jgi:hypothetical protein
MAYLYLLNRQNKHFRITINCIREHSESDYMQVLTCKNLNPDQAEVEYQSDNRFYFSSRSAQACSEADCSAFFLVKPFPTANGSSLTRI